MLSYAKDPIRGWGKRGDLKDGKGPDARKKEGGNSAVLKRKDKTQIGYS